MPILHPLLSPPAHRYALRGRECARYVLRETSETVDDVEMLLRAVLVEDRIGEFGHQAQRFALIGDILAMFEGQIGELAPCVGPVLVPALRSDAARDLARQIVGCKGLCAAAKVIARGARSNRMVAAKEAIGVGSVRKVSAGWLRSAASQSAARSRTATSKLKRRLLPVVHPVAVEPESEQPVRQSAGGGGEEEVVVEHSPYLSVDPARRRG